MSPSISFPLWLAMAGLAYGQAAVEAGLGASRAATSTAPAKGIGKSMSGLAGSLDKALKGAEKSSDEPGFAVATAKPAVTLASGAPAPAQKYEDAGGIEAGLSYQELVRRFGPPSMVMTFDGERSLTYSGKSGMYQAKVLDGKVKAVEKPQP